MEAVETRARNFGRFFSAKLKGAATTASAFVKAGTQSLRNAPAASSASYQRPVDMDSESTRLDADEVELLNAKERIQSLATRVNEGSQGRSEGGKVWAIQGYLGGALAFLLIGALVTYGTMPRSQCPSQDAVAEVLSFGDLPPQAQPTASGYLPCGPTCSPDSKMFYVFYEATGPNCTLPETPLILWLNGGPGCSSLIGCYYELGPWRVQDDLRLLRNEGAWNRKFGVLFIDNPIGTGFSPAATDSDVPKDQQAVADHLFHALSAFFDSHPSLKGRPFVIAGESYGGKYVPSLGAYLLQKEGFPVPLVGVAIGNGLTHPERQVLTHGYVAHAFGLLDEEGRQEADAMAKKAAELARAGDWAAAYRARTDLVDSIEHGAALGTILDVRRSVKYHCDPSGRENLGAYLNRREVRQALNVANAVQWVSCSSYVRALLANDTMKSTKPQVEAILSAGVPVLLYAGQFDAKDGPVTQEAWLRHLQWKETSNFWGSPRQVWRVEGKLAGYWREYENLAVITVSGAGHQVPADQPVHSRTMIETWVAQQLVKQGRQCKSKSGQDSGAG